MAADLVIEAPRAVVDGRAALCVMLRPEERERHKEITEYGGWRAYRAAQG